MNRKADFLLNESIRIDSHDESNRFNSNRELECSNGDADRLNGDHAANVRYLWKQTYSVLTLAVCEYDFGRVGPVNKVSDYCSASTGLRDPVLPPT